MIGSIVVAVGSFNRVLAGRVGDRNLGGKAADLDHLGAGEARQHLLHARIGLAVRDRAGAVVPATAGGGTVAIGR